jgi:hypothetical protein
MHISMMCAEDSSPGTVVVVSRVTVKKLLWRAALCFAAVTYVIPDVYSSVAGSRCQEWSERRVDPLYLNREQLESVADETPLVEVPILPGGYSGMALPGVVALTPGATETTKLHEMVHQEQMRREGKLKYAVSYVYDWYRGRYAGCSTSDSYESISYEKQARATVRGASRDGNDQKWSVEALVTWAEETVLESASTVGSGSPATGCRESLNRKCGSTETSGPSALTREQTSGLYRP